MRAGLVDRRPRRVPAGPESEADRVLSAALAALARNSWRDFKVHSVLREARVPLRTFYRDFAGKSDLLVALLEHEIRVFASHLSADMGAQESAADRLMVWIQRNVEVGFSPVTAGRARMFARAAEALRDDFPLEVTRTRRMIIDPLRDAIADGAAGGIFPGAQPEEDAIAIWLMTSSLLRDPSAGTARAMVEAEATKLVIQFSRRALSNGAQ
jgi:AcrR family transcriptional regulator